MGLKILNYVAGIMSGSVGYFFILVALWSKPVWPLAEIAVFLGMIAVPILLIVRKNNPEFWAGVLTCSVIVIVFFYLL